MGGVRNSRLARRGEVGVVVGIGRLGSFLESSSIDQIDNVAIHKVDHVFRDLSLLPPPPPHPQTHCEECDYAKRDRDGYADLGARVQAGGFRRAVRPVGCRGAGSGRRSRQGGAAPGGLLSDSCQGSPPLSGGTFACNLACPQVEPAGDVGGDVQTDERGCVVGFGVLQLH